ncbi:MAG: beta-L-arabinofuranosidase domain-containing protein, partial [Bacteroidota bacterium]
VALYLQRISSATTVTGGAIGDEWIAGRTADATNTGYEYCSLQELLDSYTVLLQKTGEPRIADEIENIFYNAAQGSRNPDHSAIAYLKTDNSYEMKGTRNGEIEPGRNQTRYKYSPAHQDVAVCCNPNAGRITPYFLQSAWMLEDDQTLVSLLLCPNVLKLKEGNTDVNIEVKTDYPYSNKFTYMIKLEKDHDFQIKIRKPAWVKEIKTFEKYHIENDLIVIDRPLKKEDRIDLEFSAEVVVKEGQNHEKYFTYGALVYARPINSTPQIGKEYAPGFNDWNYSSTDSVKYQFIDDHQAVYHDGKITVSLKNKTTGKIERVELVPFGKTILRQVGF